MTEVVADERSREDSTKTIEMPFDHDLSSAEIEEMVRGRQFPEATCTARRKSESAQTENSMSAYAAASATKMAVG